MMAFYVGLEWRYRALEEFPFHVVNFVKTLQEDLLEIALYQVSDKYCICLCKLIQASVRPYIYLMWLI